MISRCRLIGESEGIFQALGGPGAGTALPGEDAKAIARLSATDVRGSPSTTAAFQRLKSALFSPGRVVSLAVHLTGAPVAADLIGWCIGLQLFRSVRSPIA